MNQPYDCGSQICTQNGTAVNGNKDLNLRSPGGLILHNQWCHLEIGATPSLIYFSGDWDVHWGYDLGFDPRPSCLFFAGEPSVLQDAYRAAGLALRDRLLESLNDTNAYYRQHDVKRPFQKGAS